MDWQIPLLVSTAVFAAFLVFKMRPALTGGGVSGAELRDAKKRVDEAKDDVARAKALADAGDAAARLGRANSAGSFYLRALRANPASVEIVDRAAASLARRPAALENLVWRHLALGPWEGDRRPAAIQALRTLAAIYRRRNRHHARAQAVDHMLAALSASVGSSS